MADSVPAVVPPPAGAARPRRRHRHWRINFPGGVAGILWLGIVVVPVYWVLVTSLRSPQEFFIANQFSLPVPPAFANYVRVFEVNFLGYLMNSVIVTAGAVTLTLVVSFLAAYVIVRNDMAVSRAVFSLFLLGLAIPIQSAIIPVYYLISKAGLYDTLLALILPFAAFAVAVTVFILSNFIRDIPRELFEAMEIDGASHWQMLRWLVLPLSGPALMTVAIYDALNVWNGFLFPLVLTQSASQRVLPLALWSFQDEMTINVPVVMAAVVLTSIPMVTLYIFGRRYIVAGLTAGFGK
jgi:raffinose/stachyose/melibiose transport system permease protein